MVAGYPGIHRDVQTYLKERIREVLTGASEEIVIRIYGHDLEVIREQGGGSGAGHVGDRRHCRRAHGAPRPTCRR